MLFVLYNCLPSLSGIIDISRLLQETFYLFKRDHALGISERLRIFMQYSISFMVGAAFCSVAPNFLMTRTEGVGVLFT